MLQDTVMLVLMTYTVQDDRCSSLSSFTQNLNTADLSQMATFLYVLFMAQLKREQKIICLSPFTTAK